jgi:hypothetical protein
LMHAQLLQHTRRHATHSATMLSSSAGQAVTGCSHHTKQRALVAPVVAPVPALGQHKVGFGHACVACVRSAGRAPAATVTRTGSVRAHMHEQMRRASCASQACQRALNTPHWPRGHHTTGARAACDRAGARSRRERQRRVPSSCGGGGSACAARGCARGSAADQRPRGSSASSVARVQEDPGGCVVHPQPLCAGARGRDCAGLGPGAHRGRGAGADHHPLH